MITFRQTLFSFANTHTYTQCVLCTYFSSSFFLLLPLLWLMLCFRVGTEKKHKSWVTIVVSIQCHFHCSNGTSFAINMCVFFFLLLLFLLVNLSIDTSPWKNIDTYICRQNGELDIVNFCDRRIFVLFFFFFFGLVYRIRWFTRQARREERMKWNRRKSKTNKAKKIYSFMLI